MERHTLGSLGSNTGQETQRFQQLLQSG
jgi:hypothetical protein